MDLENISGGSHLNLYINKTEYKPGEIINGRVSWFSESAPKSVEVCLLWHTQGIGTKDVVIVDSCVYENLSSQDEREVNLKVPEGPLSFSGNLISLIWNVEVVLKPGDFSQNIKIIVSPDGRELILPQPVKDEKKKDSERKDIDYSFKSGQGR